MPPKYVVIANPHSGSADALPSLLEAVATRVPLAVWRTERPGHAIELAARAARDGFEGIVAAGGDGTIHEVINGIAPEFERLALVVLPLGTGNDFCRFVEAELDPDWLVSALESSEERRLDVLCLHLDDGKRRYAINTVSAGFGGIVTEHLDSELKSRYGPLAFLLGLREALPKLVEYRATIVLDERETKDVSAIGVVLANGSTIAGGLRIAPGARTDDGMLDVIVLEGGDALDLAALAARIAAGEILGSDSVALYAASRVRMLSEPAMPLSLDGELLDPPPREIAVELLPGVLRLRLAAARPPKSAA